MRRDPAGAGAAAVEQTAPRRRWLTRVLRLGIVLGLAAGAAAQEAVAVDWVIEMDPAAPDESLPPALLGHYDLSGELFSYDQEPGLIPAMGAVGFSDWRVGVGRWEASTWLPPTLSDGTTMCPIFVPEAAAPAGWDDLDLIDARDWFTDDGLTVSLRAPLADDRRWGHAHRTAWAG